MKTEIEGKKEPQQDAQQKTLYVDFLFFKLDPAFRRITDKERDKAVSEFREFLQESGRWITLRPYLSLGFRAEVDFLLWAITEDLQKVQEFLKGLYRT